jgi:hypothetical protein
MLEPSSFVFPTVRTVARPISGPAGFNSDGLPITISFTGLPYSEATLLGLAYSYEQATQLSMPPTTTPPLPGEVFDYQPVPEPSSTTAITLFGLTVLGLKLKQHCKIKSNCPSVLSASLRFK